MECADRTAKFIGKFDVPTWLRHVGVPREEISRIAGTVLEEVKRANTVGVEVTREELVQLLHADAIALMHEGGMRVLWQCGSVQEACNAKEVGVDAIIAQGCEAGGHVRGEVSTFVFIP